MIWKKAVLYGFLGAGVKSLLMAMARTRGMNVDVELMLGTWVWLRPRHETITLGIALYLFLGALFGALYGWLFERVLHHGGMAAGILLAIPHTVLTGLLMALVPALHPHVPELLPAPGAYLSSFGPAGVIALLVLHLVFGAIVGGGYGHVCGERSWWPRSARVGHCERGISRSQSRA